MPVRYIGALAVAGLMAATGCGGSGGSGGEEKAVRATMTALQQATARHDYPRLCQKVLSRRLITSVTRIGLPCEVALEQGLGAVKDPEVKVGKVTVKGDRALAVVRTGAAGQASSTDTVELFKENGTWKVGTLSGAGPPAPAREAP